MPISCHFRDCKALLVASLTHVSGAIASVQTFTFTFGGGNNNDNIPELTVTTNNIHIIITTTDYDLVIKFNTTSSLEEQLTEANLQQTHSQPQ